MEWTIKQSANLRTVMGWTCVKFKSLQNVFRRGNFEPPAPFLKLQFQESLKVILFKRYNWRLPENWGYFSPASQRVSAAVWELQWVYSLQNNRLLSNSHSKVETHLSSSKPAAVPVWKHWHGLVRHLQIHVESQNILLPLKWEVY